MLICAWNLNFLITYNEGYTEHKVFRDKAIFEEYRKRLLPGSSDICEIEARVRSKPPDAANMPRPEDLRDDPDARIGEPQECKHDQNVHAPSHHGAAPSCEP